MSRHLNRSDCESWTLTNGSYRSQNEELFFINRETVDVILSSKFLNCISINKYNCKDVYVASRYLNVDELVLPSTEYLRRHLNPTNYLEVFFFAQKWNDEPLMTAASDIFYDPINHFAHWNYRVQTSNLWTNWWLLLIRRYDCFSAEKKFLTLEFGKLMQFLTFSGRGPHRKEIMFQSICHWIIFNKPSNLNLINQILTCLAFPFSESYLDDCIRCMPELKKNYFSKHFIKLARLNNLCPTLNASSIDLSTIYNEKMKHHIIVAGQSMIKIKDEPNAKYRPVIEYFCPAQQIWTILEYFPKDIREYQSVISDNRLYIAGGYHHGEKPSLEVWYYDWETTEWIELAPLPHHLTNFGFVELNNFLYIVGGRNANKNFHNSILQYSMENYEWSVVAHLEHCVMDPAVVVHGQKILIAGGATMNSSKGTKSFRSFDPRTRKFEELPPMPSKKTGASICVYEGRYIYVFGGCDSRDVHCFNTKFRVWRKGLAMKKKRAKAGVFIIDQYIYVAGGEKTKKARRKSIERFDKVKNEWKITGSMSTRGAGVVCSHVPITSTDCGLRFALPIEDVKKSIERSESLK